MKKLFINSIHKLNQLMTTYSGVTRNQARKRDSHLCYDNDVTGVQ